MAETVTERLRSAPMVGFTSPYYNVANRHYVHRDDIAAALAYIAKLELKISALERYLDGPLRTSKSGVPLTATHSTSAS